MTLIRQAAVGLSLAAALLTGCATIRGVSSRLAPASEPERLVHQANTLARTGQPMAARDLYEVVIRDYTADSARADALYRLGLLQVDPRSAIRDFRAANATFARLLREHPSSRWDAEARAWQATLAALLERDEEIRRAMQRVRDSEEDTRRATQRQQRSEEERKRTKQKLEWLKESDVDLQRRR